MGPMPCPIMAVTAPSRRAGVERLEELVRIEREHVGDPAHPCRQHEVSRLENAEVLRKRLVVASGCGEAPADQTPHRPWGVDPQEAVPPLDADSDLRRHDPRHGSGNQARPKPQPASGRVERCHVGSVVRKIGRDGRTGCGSRRRARGRRAAWRQPASSPCHRGFGARSRSAR